VFFPSLSSRSEELFVIIPSIFNSPEILMIGAPHDIISHLREIGAVYLLEWQEVVDLDFKLSDYALVATQALEYISNKHPSNRSHVVGHCLGGNFAITASVLRPDLVASLTLLTTPWDFTYLKHARAIHKALELDQALEQVDFVPAIYLQILFFLLCQDNLQQKLGLYQVNQSVTNRDDIFAIERWQFSGHPIPKAAYNQLIYEFIDNNCLLNKKFIVDNTVIDPSVLKLPVILISGKKDKIAPVCSTMPLYHILPNATSFIYNTGHIGYLVGSQKENFMLDLSEWIKQLSKNERSLYNTCKA
jgi:polyhydroxyalkanoate synthase